MIFPCWVMWLVTSWCIDKSRIICSHVNNYCNNYFSIDAEKLSESLQRGETFRQSLVTSYYSLVASYQSLVTSYQSLVTSYQSLVTSYQSLVTSCQSLATSHQLLVASYYSLVTKNQSLIIFRILKKHCLLYISDTYV